MAWLNFTQSFVKFKETSLTSLLRKDFVEPARPWSQSVSTITTLKTADLSLQTFTSAPSITENSCYDILVIYLNRACQVCKMYFIHIVFFPSCTQVHLLYCDTAAAFKYIDV